MHIEKIDKQTWVKFDELIKIDENRKNRQKCIVTKNRRNLLNRRNRQNRQNQQNKRNRLNGQNRQNKQIDEVAKIDEIDKHATKLKLFRNRENSTPCTIRIFALNYISPFQIHRLRSTSNLCLRSHERYFITRLGSKLHASLERFSSYHSVDRRYLRNIQENGQTNLEERTIPSTFLEMSDLAHYTFTTKLCFFYVVQFSAQC